MKEIGDDKTVRFENLEESGKYDLDLLKGLKEHDFDVLTTLSLSKRADDKFMTPLLYAAKNELNTFRVYKYFAPSLQENEILTSEVIQSEPELLESTPLSASRDFIINYARSNTEIIKYMDYSLKNDEKFIVDLCNTSDLAVIREIASNKEMAKIIINNPQLMDNRVIASAMIQQNVSFLSFVGDNLKNDYEFLKCESLKNEEIIDYVVNNIENFGLQGIKGVRESSRNFTVDDCLKFIDEMAENSDDKRYEMVKNKVKERGIDDIHTIRWITAMAVQSDSISPESIDKILNYSILTMEKTKKDLTVKGEMNISLENMQELVGPNILNKLKEKLEKQGIEVDENLQNKIDSYTKFYKEYNERFKKQKRENYEKGLGKNDIKEVTGKAKLSEIKEVALVISGRENDKTVVEDEIER